MAQVVGGKGSGEDRNQCSLLQGCYCKESRENVVAVCVCLETLAGHARQSYCCKTVSKEGMDVCSSRLGRVGRVLEESCAPRSTLRHAAECTHDNSNPHSPCMIPFQEV